MSAEIQKILNTPLEIAKPSAPVAEPPRKLLSYDGSSLGEHEFMSVISWCHPCTIVLPGQRTPLLYAVIHLPGLLEPQYVILKRNYAGRTDQILIDELKTIFGLYKMGTHHIRLRGIARRYNNASPWTVQNVYIHPQWSDYYLFRASTLKENAAITQFVQLRSLGEMIVEPSRIDKTYVYWFYQCQKIFVFRDLFRIADTSMDNVLMKNIDSYQRPQYIPMSIDEMKIRLPGETYKQLNQTEEKWFFPRTTTRTEILIRMLGLTPDNYMHQVEIIRHSMTKIINRIDQTRLWLVDDIVDQIVDRCAIYYKMTT